MFEKSLNDLVRGIRAHKSNEGLFIGQCMVEIKKELKQENMGVKCNAIAKLIYLQMLGYDISWAAFNIVEVMSSTKFTFKRTGYLAASQCFHEGLDVVMLTTNMVRKDISSANLYDSSLALTGLACFMTPDLARDLANDVLSLTASSRPYLRKKAIIVMYKVFLKFPDALRPAFQRLKDRLEDPDSGVQCAAVSVICELARKNPRNYLSLAPTFFKLMTSSTNNWMLIKIIKLFGALTPLEPRLSKKLMEPLVSLIHSTTAMSLLYECISTVIAGMPNHTASIQLCVSKLRLYIEDADQNLKYLGLLALSKILKCQPKAVLPHKDMIMDCLDDDDDSIRLRALDLISGMVSKKTLVEIVKKMLLHCDESESSNYRDEVLSKIIHMCSQNSYQYVTNFEWYITVLVEMTRFEGTKQGHLIAGQMLDVTIRVRDVRPFAVKQMATILENTHLFSGSTHKNGICEVLYAAAWITGEFSSFLPDARGTIDALLNPKITALPAHIQAVFVQNIVKLYASILVKAEAEGTPEAVEEVGAMLVEKLPVFMQSGDLEVQERACCILQLMKYIVKLQGKGAAVADELTNLFAGDLNPVAPKAQKKVPVPAGLDLDKWINEPPEDEDDRKNDINFFLGPSSSSSSKYEDSPSTSRRTKKSKAEQEEEKEEMKKYREQRQQAQMNNPHYLKPSKSSPTPPKKKTMTTTEEGGGMVAKLDVSSIPVSRLELGVDLVIDDPKPSLTPASSKKMKKKGKKGKKGKKRRGKRGEESSEEEEEVTKISRPLVNISHGELPDGAVASEGEEIEVDDFDDLAKALNQNLDMPLRDDEVLPVRKHRVVAGAATGLKDDETEEKEVHMLQGKKKKGKEKKKERKEKEGKVKKERRKKTKREVVEDEEEDDAAPSALVDITEDAPPEPHQTLISAETTNEPSPSSSGKRKKKQKKGKGKEKGGDVVGGGREEEEEVGEKNGGGGDLDDLEFWLSKGDAPSQKKKEKVRTAAPLIDTTTLGGGGGGGGGEDVMSAFSASLGGGGGGGGGVVERDEEEEEEEEETDKKKRRKKEKREGKKEKSERKTKKKKKATGRGGGGGEGSLVEVMSSSSSSSVKPVTAIADSGLLELNIGQQQMLLPDNSEDSETETNYAVSKYIDLAEDENLRMTYEMRPNPLYSGQITVAVVFRNLSDQQLVSIEFNVLDSLNTKLERPAGNSNHEGVKIPFQLPPDTANECQLTFYVKSFLMPQKLRGTVIYMVKGESGTASEKLDFSLYLPSSAFICPIPCANQHFSTLLSGGSLCDTQTITVSVTKLAGFKDVLMAITQTLHLSVVEHIDNSASLYGCSISNHHICLLVKEADGSRKLIVNAKGSDGQLVSNLLDEIKALV